MSSALCELPVASDAVESFDDVVTVHPLNRLPGRYREWLVRRELEGLSYRELSSELGIPLGIVMSGLSRARRACRHTLAGRLGRPCQGDRL